MDTRPAISVCVEDQLYSRALGMIAKSPEGQHYLLAGFLGNLVGLQITDVLQDLGTIRGLPALPDRRSAPR
jgi:hypothetical protein